MIGSSYNKETAYDLLKELNEVIFNLHLGSLSYRNIHDLRKSLRRQLAGLIDDDDKLINYSDDNFLQFELDKVGKILQNYDYDNPLHKDIPSKYQNLLDLFRERCKHANRKYSSLRGSPYQVLFCDDCKSELGPMEFKPSFLEKNNIDLSVFDKHE